MPCLRRHPGSAGARPRPGRSFVALAGAPPGTGPALGQLHGSYQKRAIKIISNQSVHAFRGASFGGLLKAMGVSANDEGRLLLSGQAVWEW